MKERLVKRKQASQRKKSETRSRDAKRPRPTESPRRYAGRAVSIGKDRTWNYLDIADVILVAVDLRGRVTLANRRACEVLGVVDADILGQNFFNRFIPKSERAAIEALFKANVSGEVPPIEHIEVNVLTARGETRIISWHNSFLREGGTIVGVLGSGQDITEQREAEKALHQSEAEFRGLFENVLDGIYRSTPDGRILAANPALARMLGYESPDELLRLNIARDLYVRTADREQFKQSLETDGEAHNAELLLRRKDGREIVVLDNARAVRDENGRVVYYEGTLTDITEWRKAESDRSRLVNVLQASLNEIYLFDPVTLKFQFVNRGALNNLGYTADEMRALTPLDLKPGFDEESFRSLISPLLEGEKEKIVFHTNHRRADGSLYPVEVHLQLVEQAGERVFLAVILDVTERRRVEADIKRRAAELEVLYENGIAISQLLEPRAIARKVIEIMREKLNWHHIAIRQVDRQTGRLEVLAFNIPGMDPSAAAAEEERLNRQVSRVGQGLSGWVIQHGEAVRSGAVDRDSRYANTYPGLRSGLYVPMKIGERVIGSIAVESEIPDAFDETDERLLVTLAAQAAVAIENARLFHGSHERASEFSALYETTRDLAEVRDVEEQLKSITRRAMDLIRAPAGGIYLFDASRNVLRLEVNIGLPPMPGLEMQMGEGVAGRVAQTRKPLIIEDYHTWEGRSPKYEGIPLRAVLQVPMIYGGELIGVLVVDEIGDSERKFNENDARLLSLFAGTAAAAVYSARLLEETRQRAQELGSIGQVSVALRQASSHAEMLPIILDQLQALLHADGVALASVSSLNEPVVMELTRGAVENMAGVVLPAGQGVTGEVIASRRPYVVANIQDDPRLVHLKGIEAVRAVAIVPLIAQDQVIGVLYACRNEKEGSLPPAFTEGEVSLFLSVANMTANALHRASLYEQTALQAKQLAAVSRLGQMLAETGDLDTLYERLIKSIYGLLSDVCGILILRHDPERELLQVVSGYFEGSFMDPSSLPSIPCSPAAEDEFSRVIHTARPLIVSGNGRHGLQSYYVFDASPDRQAQSALFVPMMTDGKAIGLIQVLGYAPGRFRDADTELLTLVANTAAVEIENTRLFQELEGNVQRLSALHAIDTAINSSNDLRLSLHVALEQTVHLLKVDAASVLLLNPVTLDMEYAAGIGFRTTETGRVVPRLGAGLAGQAALKRSVIRSSNRAAIESCFSKSQYLELEGFESYIAVPLVSKGIVVGVLEIFQRAPLEPDPGWFEFFNVLAAQVALAVDNARMFEGMENANLELALAYDATIEGWSRALDLRDRETEGHTRRVAELTLTLARRVGIPEQQIPHIRRGALLHDIGKMGIPDEILRKPGELAEEEWAIMRQHPRMAYELLSPIAYLRPALDIPYCHHEKWDGSGYPRGLKGEEIPMTARLFAVVDVYDALTSVRPYRPAWSPDQALAYIREQSGRHFDPRVVETFFNLILETELLIPPSGQK
ncbi:MAG: GAF domain-containing protein [Chloroflexota bacterium]